MPSFDDTGIFNPLFGSDGDIAMKMKMKTKKKSEDGGVRKNYKIDLNVPKFQTDDANNKVLIFEISCDGTCCLQEISHKELLASIYDEAESSSVDNFSGSISKMNARDLRRLDYRINPNEGKSVSVRYNAVAFSMDSIRAIVTSKKLYFVVPVGADSILTVMEASMKGWDNSNESFELHVYDALLNSMLTLDSYEYQLIDDKFHDLIAKLKKHSFISLKMQEKLRLLKNEVAKFTRHISNTQKILSDLLEDEERLVSDGACVLV